MSNTTCEKCGAPVSNNNDRTCRKCDGKKFVSGAKNLFSHLVHDVKGLTARFRKVRVNDQ